ncbi:MAG TPA: MBL fold metallo-hydrolase [Chryseolinea sp.]|nr:MBL fold metallo-hydrolase [Chryseolinea sp.]
MITIQSFVFNAFQENTYIISDDTKECAIVDPGCYEEHEKKELSDYILENQLSVKMLLNTHCHIDHILGNEFVKQKYGSKLYLHKTEVFVLNAQKILAAHYGFNLYQPAAPDNYLNEGDSIEFGTQKFSVLFVPGHSPGHIAFYSEKEKVVLAGDVLFLNSVGRTDLPGGNHNTLIDSIHKKLFTLPDDVTVYPGHGNETTIGVEKRTNPFCALTLR